MPVIAVLLFGSLARGEHSSGSDVDVLFVEDAGGVRHTTSKKISIFNYPRDTLMAQAASGDLFACHLAFEAKAIIDPGDHLSRLREGFSFKPSYQVEIEQATDLGWFLVRHGGRVDAGLVAKRMIWCVRTILIARSAEDRRPVFSPNMLAERCRSGSGRELLLRRHDRAADALMRDRLRTFLGEEAPHDPIHRQAGFDEFVARFESTANRTGIQTASRLSSRSESYG